MKLIKQLSRLWSTQAAVFRQFAHNYDMVYFGRLHQEDEDHYIVRGVTVSTQHIDEHYCVGTIHGYDVVALKRTDRIMQANSSRVEKYTWLIMQFDLHTSYDFPHVFIDGQHHNEAFYQALFVKFARLMKLDKSALSETSPTFNDRFTAYTPPDALDELPELLGGVLAETMAHHFAHLDFEWYQDKLIVYSTGRMPTKHLLEHMLRAGLWLADLLDAYGKQKISAHHGADIPSWRR